MNVNNETSEILKWFDYLIIAIILSISILMGIYYHLSGGHQKTGEEYFSANHSVNTAIVAITMSITFLSGITMLGMSGEIYTYGSQYIVSVFGFFLATPIVAFFYLPVFFRLQHMSVFEYLERRFGTVARLTANTVNLIQMSLYTGIVLYAPALALEATTGLSSTSSILLIGLASTFYSSIGGIKAVLATNIFQGFLMIAIIFCVIGIACYDLENGFTDVWDAAMRGHRLEVLNFDIDPTVRHTWWTLVIGTTFYFASLIGVNQIHVQRLLSAKSLRSAQIALFLNAPMIVFVNLATMLVGLTLYAWFENCDPIATDKVSSVDQIMPYFAKVRMSMIPGLMGFFIAGIFSATLSTISAMLNSLAAIAIADYVKPIYRIIGREFSDSKAATFGKIICFANGILCLASAFLVSHLGNLVQAATSINGAIGGPVLGLFSLGMFVESANEIGSVVGIVLSVALSSWMIFGQPRPPIPQLPVSIDKCPNSSNINITNSYNSLNDNKTNASDYFYLYRISYQLYTPLGIATTMIIGYVASIIVQWFAKTPIVEPDPDLFTPFLAACMRRRRQKKVQITKNH